MDYVNDESASRARDWERRFRALPPMAGVIFVGVDALPVANGESTTYEVRLGITRQYDKGTGLALVKQVLEEEIEAKRFNINVAVYRGISGACHEGNARPGPSSS